VDLDRVSTFVGGNYETKVKKLKYRLNRKLSLSFLYLIILDRKHLTLKKLKIVKIALFLNTALVCGFTGIK
jgi:hypothetical protein